MGLMSSLGIESKDFKDQANYATPPNVTPALLDAVLGPYNIFHSTLTDEPNKRIQTPEEIVQWASDLAMAGMAGVTTPGKGGKFLRGGKTEAADPFDAIRRANAENPIPIYPEVDGVSNLDEAFAKALEIVRMQPNVLTDRKTLRYRPDKTTGYTGNAKMAQANETYPSGRNTYDYGGCGRGEFCRENELPSSTACYGGNCYAEAGIKFRGGNELSISDGTLATNLPARDPLRKEIRSEVLESGPDAARELYPGHKIKEYPGSGKVSVARYEKNPAARISTNLQPAKGQDIRAGVDTDGAAWLADPKVMDALLAADPRTLSVYSSAYYDPPVPHPLSGRTMINGTVSGDHALPETLARLLWAKEARDNGFNTILREVVAHPNQFPEDAERFNRLHQGLMNTDFFMMEQPLHKGSKHSESVGGLPKCCVGDPDVLTAKGKPAEKTCANCQTAEGLGRGFLDYWDIKPEGLDDLILPGVPDYHGNRR